MRALIQRVSRAQCAEKTAYNKNIADIGKGLLMLVGFEATDSPVSIEQMVQEGRSSTGGAVSVVLLTHPASEGSVRGALQDIAQLDDLTEPAHCLRIEEL